MTDDETWVEADHANTINTFDVGDTRTTHAVIQSDSYWVEDCENAALRANGANDGPPRTDKQPLVTQTFSVYPEGGNGADIAASEVERSPSLTQVKSERGIHVTHTLTSAGHDASEDGTGRGTPIVPHIASTLQGSSKGSRGWRNDAEGMAGGHILPEQMSVRRLTPIECERLMGWPDDWTAPEGIKAPDSKRYAACGDGIVSHVAYWIGMRIQMIENES